MMEWQPIETAPKDGTPHVRGMWTYDLMTGKAIEWMSDAGYEDEDGDWVLSDACLSGWRAEDYTHWIPLPKPPSQN